MKTTNKKENGQWELLVLTLKNIAEDKGITQQQIADETGLLRSNVSRFFSLRYKPTIDVILKVATATNVDLLLQDADDEDLVHRMLEKAKLMMDTKNTSK